MPALDTNVLVRWLVADDTAQCARASALFSRARGQGLPLWIGATVLLETEWVLRSRYRISGAAFLRVLKQMLETAELQWFDEAVVERSVWLQDQHPAADYADCLHAAVALGAGQAPLLSFDRAACRLSGVEAL